MYPTSARHETQEVLHSRERERERERVTRIQLGGPRPGSVLASLGEEFSPKIGIRPKIKFGNAEAESISVTLKREKFLIEENPVERQEFDENGFVHLNKSLGNFKKNFASECFIL